LLFLFTFLIWLLLLQALERELYSTVIITKISKTILKISF